MRLLTLFILLWFSPAVFATQIPAKVFGSLPDFRQLSLSPNGKKIAFLTRYESESEASHIFLGVYDSETKEVVYPIKSDNKEFVINWIRWANDEKVLVSANFAAHRYGTATIETRMLVADVNTNKFRNLLHTSFLKRLKWIPQFQDQIVDMLPDDPDHILIALDGVQSDPDVYKVNLKKKKIRAVQRSKNDVVSWITDRQHNVRIGVERDEASYRIIERPVGKKKWRTLFEFEAFAADQVWPLGFGYNHQELYVSAYHDGREAIFKVDLSTEALEKELIFADDFYDVDGGIIYSQVSEEVIGTTYSADGGSTYWSKRHESLQRGIDKVLPDTSNSIISFSSDERRVLILSTNDTNSGTYSLLDRNSKQLEPIVERYKHLPAEAMSEKLDADYIARDGTEIEAYLTLPKNYKKGDRLPTVIHPHGGPISYDNAGFDVWTQFFASRGYAVLQMNFRGSAGYGYDFMAAGLQNWGKAMQDDVEDGTRFLIQEGIADPEKICIVGASYGGYAALMALIKTPDLYQCAVSFAGVTDVSFMMKKARRYTNYEVAKKQIGSNHKELRAVSPVNYVEKITKPVLLIHGDKDRSVLVKHSQKMFKKMQKAGKDVEYIELEDTDHYLSDNDGRVITFEAMDEFLTRFLGPKS